MLADSFETIIQRRRSNRRFDPAIAVADEVIERSLKRAILSPNSSNMQLWEFYWIQSPEEKAKFHALCLGQSAAKNTAHLVVFVTRQDLWSQRAKWNLSRIQESLQGKEPGKMEKRGLQYYSKLMPLLYRQDPFGLFTGIRKAMCFFMGIRKPFMRFGGKADQRVTVHKSCALAAQTFMLSIAAEGYESCPMEGFDAVRVKKELGLPSGAEINMIVSVGKGTDEGIWGERFRLPYENVVFKR
ncbi:nitroreductase family protein [Aquirufa sp. OSTEICH-129V]|uniref:Nitroreductase family protein n=1 Tax=Aquirufa avitistagni TaxID=3104728 RepID=A0ABW6D8D7_9BACT